ncbi:hypothetical protein A2468_02975 [Candidatus Falkowbacteria bacterium RIFOXYC2_FULL_46_15]|nr:MAG: hypothetical protein A2468_02975 [Candidatus Falkowbacteria bacterium RIFOXYC2_FULL_46_15]
MLKLIKVLFLKTEKIRSEGEKMDIDLLRDAIEASWGKDTCYPPLRDKWEHKHPSFGQCAVTALVVQDYRGGKIAYCIHAHHYWNKIGPEKTDLTIAQFGPETEICEDGTRSRKTLLDNANTDSRYRLLKAKVEKFLKIHARQGGPVSYKENPKTKASGIIAAIPQTGTCPNRCKDCFFQSGRSYLEPLSDNLPNMPSPEEARGRIIRVNDGNDSNVHRDLVLSMVEKYGYRDFFFNTAIPRDLEGFKVNGRMYPVVLTANPADMTDKNFYALDPVPRNLMFVRFRTNFWNRHLMQKCVEHYSERQIPVILTFMAYYEDVIPVQYKKNYVYRQRTLNSYWAITTAGWRKIMRGGKYFDPNNKWVYSCGKIEGELGTTACHRCGNCLREYFATQEKIRNL